MEADLRRIEALGGEEAASAANLRREAVSRVAGTKSNIWTDNKDKSNIFLGLVGKVKSLCTLLAMWSKEPLNDNPITFLASWEAPYGP